MVHKLEKSGSIEEYYRSLVKLMQHAPRYSLANQDYSFDSKVSDPRLSPWETKSLHCLLFIQNTIQQLQRVFIYHHPSQAHPPSFHCKLT